MKQMIYSREADISARTIGTIEFINPTKFDIDSFIIFIIFEKLDIINVTIRIYST